MLLLAPHYVDGVRSARSGADLHEFVQSAVNLEHSTIPPYLCAYYSLRPGTNDDIARTIRKVVIEEMLHMTIAANLLTALGGTAQIAHPEFVPRYPSRLPMNVGDDSLVVGLEPYSPDLVRTVFMSIEEPEVRHDYPVEPLALEQERYATIGQFYRALETKLVDLGDGAFVGDHDHQVVDPSWFSRKRLFPIHGVADACRAIDLIVEEGEGTTEDPLNPEGEPAHYYRFAELANGRRLVRTSYEPGYAYAGDPVDFDPGGVWTMPRNPKLAHYREGTRSRFMAETFSEAYTRLLHALQQAFAGRPERLSAAVGLMFEMRLVAQSVLETKDDEGRPTGLCFEYWPPRPSPGPGPVSAERTA